MFLRTESYKKGIFYSSGFNVLAKILTFSQGLVIAYYFGTKSETDVYFYCFSTITLISIYFGSMNHTVIIPEAMRIKVQNSDEDAMSFLNFFLGIYSFIIMLLTFILLINPIKIFSIISNFNSNLLNINKQLVLFSIPLLFLITLTTYLTDILTSYKYFTIPMIAATINSLFVLLFIFLFHNSLSILSILFGLTCGYILNIVFLLILLKRMGWIFKFKFIKISLLNKKNIFYAQLGNITSILGSYLPLYLISSFNPGIITALNYGQKVANIPDQFVTTQVSQVMGIKFNELYAKKDFVKLNESFKEAASFLMFVSLPISFIFFLFCELIIKYLYMRGAFDKHSVIITSEFLKYFGLILPFIALNTLGTRLLMASQKIKASFYSQIIINVLFLILLYFLIKKIGPLGYPLSILIYLPISVLPYSYFLFKYLFPEFEYFKVINSFFLIAFLNILISTPIYILIRYEMHGILFFLFSVLYYLISLIFVNNYFVLSKHGRELFLLVVNKIFRVVHF